MVDTPKQMVYFMENPNLKWMIQGYPSIFPGKKTYFQAKKAHIQRPRLNQGTHHAGSETSPVREGVVSLRQHQLQGENHAADGCGEGGRHLVNELTVTWGFNEV